MSDLGLELQVAVSPHVGPLENQPVTLDTVPFLQPHKLENFQIQTVKAVGSGCVHHPRALGEL